MWRLTSLALLTLLLCLSAFGQTSTTVSGTIQDSPDGQAWFGGTYSFVFRTSPSNSTGQYFWAGVPFSTSQTIAGNLDGSGHYSVSIPSNTSIAPAGSTWDLTVCPLATAVCFTVQSITITGPTQTVAPIPPSIRINMGSPPPNTRAYTDAEMVAGALGQTYYNIVDATPHYCATFPCGWQLLKGLINVTVAPTGACTPGSTPEQVISTGVIYTCQGGTWAAVASSAAAASPVNVFQKNIGGVLGASNCLELGSVLNCLDDPHFRGPNLGVDVTVSPFNARAVNPNAVPAPTATISSGTNTAVVSANTGLVIGDGFSIVGAGAPQSMATPIAPTVTPSCASGLTGLGYTVPAGAGATAYQYQIAMRDTGQGLTAASSVGTTSTGNATLGANNTAWTSSASGASNTFTATVGSTANLAVGCVVLLKGSTDDAEFGGTKIIASIVDGTHFTYTSGVDASRGISTTTATGGTVYYWLCNHIVLPTPGAGGIQYLIYGRTSGSNLLIGESLIASLGYTDASYNTWDDYGATMMGNLTLPWWAPTAPPGSPINDTLTTTITNIVSTTLTLANNAGTSVTTALARFDNSPNIAAAITAVTGASTGQGGTIRFPVVVENSGTGASCYVTSSFLDATGVNAAIQDGTICLGDTLKFSGDWHGTNLSAARMVFGGTNSLPRRIPIFLNGANPGIWLTGGSLSDLIVKTSGNAGIGVFNTGGNAAQIFENVNFDSTLGNPANDYMSIPFYDYHGASGAFGFKMRNASFTTGPNQTDGLTLTPAFVSKFNTLLDFDYISGNRRGWAIIPHTSGLSGKFHMGGEVQGLITPMLTIMQENAGNVGGFFQLENTFTDTSSYPILASLSPACCGTNADIVITGGNAPSSSGPFISGSLFNGAITFLGASPSALSPSIAGQNINIMGFGRNSNFISTLRVPSLKLTAINYSGNHTLVANEGIVNAQATLTFTVDTTLGDGQMWDVYSEIGTTTLTVSAGTLHGNAATGAITIPNNSGMHVFLKGGNAYAYGLGGGGGGGSPGGATNALQSNGGGSSFQGTNPPAGPGIFGVIYDEPTSAAVPPAIRLPGVPVNNQVGASYTIGGGNYWNDRASWIRGINSGAQTYTAVNPSTPGFGFNMPYTIWNFGTGTITETTSGFKMNGVLNASLVIPPNWVAPHTSDSVDLYAPRFPSYEAFPSSCTTALTVVAGVFGCGAAGSVSAISGDAGLFCNVSSTGAVTLVPCATTLAHKFWGNNTGSTGTAAFVSIGKADLPATTVFTDQTNTYGAFNQDFSATTIKMPTAAGFTSSATSTCGYDSTAKITHCYTNNADADVAATTSTSTTVTQVLHATAIAGIYSPSAIVLADLPAPSFPLTVAGTVTSGGIPCFTSTTQESSSALLTVNVLTKGGGAGVCPTNSSITDNATLISTTEGVSIAPTSTSQVGLIVNNPTSTSVDIADFQVNSVNKATIGNGGLLTLGTATCTTIGTAGGICPAEGTAPTNVSGAAPLYPDSTTHEYMAATNGSSSFGMMVRRQPGAIHQTAQTAAIGTATLCAASAGACNVAGQYHVHLTFIETGTACATPGTGGVTFLLTWTDSNATTHSAVSIGFDDASAINAVSQTFHFQTTLAAAWASGDFNISTNGAVIQYATGYTACGVGTGTYQLDAVVTRVQ